MTEQEKEILEATKEFAEIHRIPYDDRIESMILNAMREVVKNCSIPVFEKLNKINTQKLEIPINQLERVHRDMNDCVNRFILKDAIDQLRKQVKLFSMPVVVGQREQLKALLEKLLNENMCSVVGDELIEDALKGF